MLGLTGSIMCDSNYIWILDYKTNSSSIIKSINACDLQKKIGVLFNYDDAQILDLSDVITNVVLAET